MNEASFSRRKPKASAAKRGPNGKRGTGDKRERIVDAAIGVFAKAGFHAARVSDVAKAAGVADGTIYLYFDSKEALLISILESRVERLLSVMRERIPAETNAAMRLRSVIELQLGLLDGEKDLAEVVTMIVRQSPELMKDRAVPKFSSYLEAISDIISAGQKDGSFRADVSPNLVARAIFGALDGLALTWALGKADRGGLTGVAAQIAEIFLGGLAVPGKR
ncbi:MAG: TetR/AcrR family transcriptional regulator [Polyangiaceae bacterium]